MDVGAKQKFELCDDGSIRVYRLPGEEFGVITENDMSILVGLRDDKIRPDVVVNNPVASGPLHVTKFELADGGVLRVFPTRGLPYAEIRRHQLDGLAKFMDGTLEATRPNPPPADAAAAG